MRSRRHCGAFPGSGNNRVAGEIEPKFRALRARGHLAGFPAGSGGRVGAGPTAQIMDCIYQFEMAVPGNVVDENRHVNNVAYVQWMQEAAIRHSEASGCTRMTREVGAMWVVRTHRIEYFRPGFAGDLLTVQTWVADFRRVRSLRRYRFLRGAEQAMLAEGETDWVFVDATTGRPRAVPREIQQAFGLPTEL